MPTLQPFAGVNYTLNPSGMGGLYGVPQSSIQTEPFNGTFYDFCSGDAGSHIPDVTYNQAAAVVLVPKRFVPPKCRIYVKSLEISVTGATAWAIDTTGIGIEFTDTLGIPVAGAPASALQAYKQVIMPTSTSWVTNSVTVTGSSSTVTAVNFATTPFVASATNSLIGQYATCISSGAGTAANVGQTRRITAHTTGQLTFLTGSQPWPVAPAASDVFVVWAHQTVTGCGATTIITKDALTTSAMVGQSVTILTDPTNTTAPGQVRGCTANTTSTLTTATYANAPSDLASVVAINTGPALLGVNDFYNIAGARPVLTVGEGLQVSVVGAMTAGSPIRIKGQVWFAP